LKEALLQIYQRHCEDYFKGLQIMALPKIETPTFELELPSTGEKIKARPFLVKEQKHLLIAQESENSADISSAISKVIHDCTFQKISTDTVPMFDIEYLFVKIRGKSVGEKVELNVLCPDDQETRVDVTVNLDEIEVQIQEDHTNEIDVAKDVKLYMRYPYLNDMDGIDELAEMDIIFTLLKRCISEIHYGEDVYYKADITEQELDEFLDSLTTESFENIAKFFDTMPRLTHIINVTNPKTKKTEEVILQGMESFFG